MRNNTRRRRPGPRPGTAPAGSGTRSPSEVRCPPGRRPRTSPPAAGSLARRRTSTCPARAHSPAATPRSARPYGADHDTGDDGGGVERQQGRLVGDRPCSLGVLLLDGWSPAPARCRERAWPAAESSSSPRARCPIAVGRVPSSAAAGRWPRPAAGRRGLLRRAVARLLAGAAFFAGAPSRRARPSWLGVVFLAGDRLCGCGLRSTARRLGLDLGGRLLDRLRRIGSRRLFGLVLLRQAWRRARCRRARRSRAPAEALVAGPRGVRLLLPPEQLRRLQAELQLVLLVRHGVQSCHEAERLRRRSRDYGTNCRGTGSRRCGGGPGRSACRAPSPSPRRRPGDPVVVGDRGGQHGGVRPRPGVE